MPETLELLGTPGAILVQFIAPLGGRDDALQGHVQEGTKTLGDHCFFLIFSASTANLVGGTGSHAGPDTIATPSRAPDHARPGKQEALLLAVLSQ